MLTLYNYQITRMTVGFQQAHNWLKLNKKWKCASQLP